MPIGGGYERKDSDPQNQAYKKVVAEQETKNKARATGNNEHWEDTKNGDFDKGVPHERDSEDPFIKDNGKQKPLDFNDSTSPPKPSKAVNAFKNLPYVRQIFMVAGAYELATSSPEAVAAEVEDIKSNPQKAMCEATKLAPPVALLDLTGQGIDCENAGHGGVPKSVGNVDTSLAP